MPNLEIHSPHNREIPQKSTLIMGILNFTPDSFSENGEFFNVDKALAHCEKMLNEGMDILDVGLESTRPNAIKVAESEELRRIKKILPALREKFPSLLISIDTYKAAVADYALSAGADIINDVFGGAFEENVEQVAMYELVAKWGCPIVITHNSPVESVDGILNDLGEMANLALASGVKKEQIILDYGFGFNKTMAQNLDMQRQIKRFKDLKYPLLVGLSRKSTLRNIVGEIREDLDDATLAFFAHSLCENSVSIFRTHNVRKAKICLDCIGKIKE